MTWSMLYLYLVVCAEHLFGWITVTSRDMIPKGGLITEFSKNWQRLLCFGRGVWLGWSSWAGCTELRQDVQAQLAKAKDRLAKVHMHEIAFNQYQTLLVLNMLSNQDNMFVHSTHTGHCIHTLFLIYDGLWPVSWNRYNMHWRKRRALLRGKWTVGWRPVFGCSILWYMSCAS